MNGLFIIIFLISLVAFIIGIFKPTSFSKINIHTRKSSSILFGSLFLLSFLLIGATSPPQPLQSNQNQTLQTVSSSVPTFYIKPTIAPTVVEKLQPHIISPTTTSYNSTQISPSVSSTDTTNSGLSNNNYYTNVNGNQVHSPAYSTNGQVPAGATAKCNDGTYSFSQHHNGTCSGHGGVAEWL